MSPVIPFRRRSSLPSLLIALGAVAAAVIGFRRDDTVRFNGVPYRLVGIDTPERGEKAL